MDENLVRAKLYELAAETGKPADTLGWVFGALVFSKKHLDGKVNAEQLCVLLVKDANELIPGRLEQSLREWGIEGGEDVGVIVAALEKKGLATKDEGDSEADFEGIFTVERLDDFMRRHGIRRKRFGVAELKRRLAWTLYVVGFLLVAASYGSLVSKQAGWAGWVVGMVGFLIFYLPDPRAKRYGVTIP